MQLWIDGQFWLYTENVGLPLCTSIKSQVYEDTILGGQIKPDLVAEEESEQPRLGLLSYTI